MSIRVCDDATAPANGFWSCSRARSATCCAAGRRSTPCGDRRHAVDAGRARGRWLASLPPAAVDAAVDRPARGRRPVRQRPARARDPRAASAGFDASTAGPGRRSDVRRAASRTPAAGDRRRASLSRHARGRARQRLLRPLPRGRRRAPTACRRARRGASVGRRRSGDATGSARACSSFTRQRRRAQELGGDGGRGRRVARRAADAVVAIARSGGDRTRATRSPPTSSSRGEPLDRVAAVLRRARPLSRQRLRHQPSRRPGRRARRSRCSADTDPAIWAPLGAGVRVRPRRSDLRGDAGRGSLLRRTACRSTTRPRGARTAADAPAVAMTAEPERSALSVGRVRRTTQLPLRRRVRRSAGVGTCTTSSSAARRSATAAAAAAPRGDIAIADGRIAALGARERRGTARDRRRRPGRRAGLHRRAHPLRLPGLVGSRP